MPVTIPTDTTLPSYIQTTEIDGQTYRVRLDYNERVAAWYLSMYDADENPIILGRKVLNRWSLLRHFAYRAVPNGVTFCDDIETRQKPGRFDLGGDATLVFVAASEL